IPSLASRAGLLLQSPLVSLLIRNATILTMNDRWEVVEGGGGLVRDGLIVDVAAHVNTGSDTVIDAAQGYLLPGFVQTHIHLCQTLFRGSADDLALLEWLKARVWPMAAAHTPQTLRSSARLGIAELIKGGTTCALTMETVRHTEEVFRVVQESGFRAHVGKSTTAT